MIDDALLDAGAGALGERGHWITDAFVDRALAEALADDARTRLDRGDFARTQVGRGPEKRHDLEIRGDQACWVSDWSSPSLARYRATIEMLRLALLRTLYVGARWFEALYAHYPPGTRYAKHMDQHRGAPHRLYTCILYLSEQEGGGGELKVYDPLEPGRVVAEIEPRVGRFACLASARVPHEVAPARFDRLTLTGWLRDDAPPMDG